MFTTPALPFVNAQVQVLLDQLPDIRRADEDGVHEARVAMRRLREVLPLLAVTHPGAASELRKVARRVGRNLGRLRELDVMRVQLDALEGRTPGAAAAVAAALDHAAGVYFPNRLHRLRVMVKKLRYSVEAAETMGLWRPPRLLRDLRRVQARLGTLHDVQALEEAVERLDDAARGSGAAPRSDRERPHA